MNPRLIRTLYLYLFAALGLGLTVIGTVQLVDLGLRAWVFRSADDQPPTQPTTVVDRILEDKKIDLETLNNNLADCGEGCHLTKDEQTLVKNWLADYKDWRTKMNAYDAVKTRRQRVASGGIAAILIGLPIFIYHWLIIRRELKAKKDEQDSGQADEQDNAQDNEKNQAKHSDTGSTSTNKSHHKSVGEKDKQTQSEKKSDQQATSVKKSKPETKSKPEKGDRQEKENRPELEDEND